MAKATLKTVAQHTGLSVTTVSRALKEGDDVKQSTKDIVREAAKLLGYRPNPSGVGLRTGICYNICAVLPMTKQGDIGGDIGVLALIEGLTAGIENTPYHLTVLPLEPGQDPLEPVKYAVENNLAGGIVFNLTKGKDERVSYLTEQNVPFVTFGQTEMSIEHPYVDADNYDIGYRAASYLFEKGRSNIRVMSSSQIYTFSSHKYYGVKRAAMEYGREFSEEQSIIYDRDVIDYRDLGKELMQSNNPPDCIVCGSEISACGVIAGVQDANKVIGKDIDVVTVETCDLARYFTPPISGFHQDFHVLGRKLSSFIVQRIEGAPINKLQYVERATFYQR